MTLTPHLFFSRKLSLSTNCIEKIANLNGLSKKTSYFVLYSSL